LLNIVLKAWGNSGAGGGGGIDGARRAEAVLCNMIRLHGNGHECARPDALSFSTVIGAYSRAEPGEAAAYSRAEPGEAAAAVDSVMGLLEELEGTYLPDGADGSVESCYNAAANVVAKSGLDDAVERVGDLMGRMRNMDVAPGGNILASLIEAYANEGSEGSLRRGRELLLEKMDGPEPEIEPNSVPFNVLLGAILNGDSTNKIERADELMALMEKIGGDARPDSASYNMIISALSRSPSPGSERKAVDYLRDMLSAYRGGYKKAKPDLFAFNCVIGMLARSRQDWADDIIHRTLEAMESQRRHGNASVVPDTIAYNLVIGSPSPRPTGRTTPSACWG